MLGVWSFVYALAHVVIYLALDQLCYSRRDLPVPADLGGPDASARSSSSACSRSSILPLLALTSTNGWMRRLGRNWQRLHRLVYVAAVAGVVHFVWGQKADISEPLKWARVPGGAPGHPGRASRSGSGAAAARSGCKSLIHARLGGHNRRAVRPSSRPAHRPNLPVEHISVGRGGDGPYSRVAEVKADSSRMSVHVSV